MISKTDAYARLLALIETSPGVPAMLKRAHDMSRAGRHIDSQLVVAMAADALVSYHRADFPDVLLLRDVLGSHFLDHPSVSARMN